MEKIKIEVSARHCHLMQEHLDQLFGAGYELKKMKDLSQIGQFASEETVTIKTPSGVLEKVRILGPVREETQVELSMTEARKLKLQPPIRLSGDIAGSAGCIIVGPAGEVEITEGVIVAKRHIHCDPQTAEKHNWRQNQILSVQTPGERGLIFHEVEMRIDPEFVFVMHIDTDEGNACLPGGACCEGEVIIKD